MKKKFGLGVYICIFNEDISKILFVKRNKEKRTKQRADWGNIGGKIEPGETSKESCLRETKEETGLKLDKNNINLIEVKELPNFHPEWHGIQFIYAVKINENTKIKINDESESFKWFSLDNLPESMLDKKEDIISIAERFKNKCFIR